MEPKSNYSIKKEEQVQLNVIDFIIFSIIATSIPSLWMYYQKLAGAFQGLGIIFVPLITILFFNILIGFLVGIAPLNRFYKLLAIFAIHATSLTLALLLVNDPDFNIGPISRYFQALLIFFPISLIGLFIGMASPVTDKKSYRKLSIIGAIIIGVIILLILKAK